jgi:peptidyl-prolyl cis-trans isomerase D
VTTDFGLHLIQITNVSNTSKKYKIVYFDKDVIASSETKDNYYSQANDFINLVNSKDDDTSFSSFSEGENLLVREDVNVNNMKFNISSLENSRKIVKWMFDENTKVGDVSNSIYTCGDDYVVVSLSAITPEGDKELESVRNIISQKIQNDKKFDIISSKLIKSSSLEDAASLYNSVIDTVVGVNFASNNINGIGSEQNFVGAVNALDIGETSTIIKGNNSAYIISIVSKNSGTISEITEKQKLEIQNANSAGVFNNAVVKFLKDNSEIVDNRFNYY